MNYRWIFKNNDESTVHKLAKNLKIPKSLANVLAARNLETIEDAEKFFKPSLDDIHDPFLMRDMDKAADRTLEAIKRGELIWVHGDYDVDGTASTAMVCQFLREIGARVEYYIPDRFQEGYGLSRVSIQTGYDRGAKVLLTVDVGITAYDQLEFALGLGMDTIICDHHEPGDEIPRAFAILDPVLPDCPYPFKFLAACGVTFKFIQAIAMKLGILDRALSYLDYVALASAADMVPLLDENRILVHYGLELLNSAPRPGLKGLIYCTGLKSGSITAMNIIYALAPLINAAGRLGDARRSVEMMLQSDEIASFRIAQELEEENRKRRIFDQQTFEESIPMAERFLEDGSERALVLHAPHWHAGVIGIVASRLVDRFHVPTVLLTTIDGVAKGSARSISNFDIHAALKKCERFLTEFGGHKHAAGLSLPEKNIPAFREAFNAIANSHISRDMLVPEIVIDSELKLNELSPLFFKSLGRFAPFGFSNNKPVFFSRGVKSLNGIKILGGNTIKFRAYQNNFVIDAVGHNLAHKVELCNYGKRFSVVYNLEFTNSAGQKSPQINIKDIKPDD
ncbi:MAG: single-stranded-DNA-specific exonuclease RecJ [Chloroflexota bacterium]